MSNFILKRIVTICFIGFPLVIFSQDSTTSTVIPEPKEFVTKHQIINGGKTIDYTATAKETYLTNEKGEPVASIWSVAYTKNNIINQSTRPVTFVFNGGPGSASVWLHFGMFGPEIVARFGF